MFIRIIVNITLRFKIDNYRLRAYNHFALSPKLNTLGFSVPKVWRSFLFDPYPGER